MELVFSMTSQNGMDEVTILKAYGKLIVRLFDHTIEEVSASAEFGESDLAGAMATAFRWVKPHGRVTMDAGLLSALVGG